MIGALIGLLVLVCYVVIGLISIDTMRGYFDDGNYWKCVWTEIFLVVITCAVIEIIKFLAYP